MRHLFRPPTTQPTPIIRLADSNTPPPVFDVSGTTAFRRPGIRRYEIGAGHELGVRPYNEKPANRPSSSPRTIRSLRGPWRAAPNRLLADRRRPGLEGRPFPRRSWRPLPCGSGPLDAVPFSDIELSVKRRTPAGRAGLEDGPGSVRAHARPELWAVVLMPCLRRVPWPWRPAEAWRLRLFSC